MNLKEFMYRTGLSQRQADYWANMGMFGPDYKQPGSGNSRDYPADLVPVVRIARKLVELLPKDAFKVAKSLVENGMVDFGEDVEFRLNPTSELVSTEVMRLGMQIDQLIHDLEHVTAERDRAEQQLRLIRQCGSQFDARGVIVRCAKGGVRHNQHTNVIDPAEEEMRFTFVWHDNSPGVVREVIDNVG